MSNKVFVGSLSFKTEKDALESYFAQVGTVTKADVIHDKMTGKHKGFGFVEFSSEDEAKAAVEKLNNTELDGRTIFVDLARPSEKKSFSR